ncbi:MAG: UrcA family protein [Parahaliea sp.]
MTIVRNIKLALVATGIAAALVSLPTVAGPHSETVVKSQAARSRAVSFEDLDLTSARGQESLYFRLSTAARTVCGSADHRIAGSLANAAANRACHEQALNDALNRVYGDRVATTAD